MAIGSLTYFGIGTRLDIGFAIGKLSKFCEWPENKHWDAVKHVLRYICGLKSVGSCYGGEKSIVTHGYRYIDWGGDISSRESTRGYIFTMGGGTISLASRKRMIVATSPCEPEYTALCAACKEFI